jgi:predicted O-methyltransferase YrrM
MKPVIKKLSRVSYRGNLIALQILKTLLRPKEAKEFFIYLYRYAQRKKSYPIKAVEPQDCLPGIDETAVSMLRASFKEGAVSHLELYLLSAITQHIRARKIFEIGTFQGLTSLHMALNSEAEARIFTLDLPQASISSTAFALSESDKKYADKSQSGEKFRGLDIEYKVEQLFGDSATFDFSPFYGEMDLIFIDGSHQYQYVKKDSENALRMLKEGKGVIVWHDYARQDGVTKALNELSSRELLYWVKGTSLVVFIR